METYKRRKLFDDDDDEEEEQTYVPGGDDSSTTTTTTAKVEVQKQEVEAKVSVSGGRKLFDDDEDDNTNQYTPSNVNDKEDVYQTAYDNAPTIKPVETAVKSKIIDDDEEEEYKPSYQQKTKDPSPKPQPKVEAQSTFASERRNLFDDEPIQIDQNANKQKDDEEEYVPKKVEEDLPKQKPVIEKQKTQVKKVATDERKNEQDQKARQEAERLKQLIMEDLGSMKDVNLEEPIKEEEDPKIKQFSVMNPAKIGGHIKYQVAGVDSEGAFEDVRRFSQFFALKNALQQRWPGIYIPALPEKKLVGNNEAKFVEERRSLLERFMKEIAKCDYLVHSKEFRIFAREKGDVEKILNSLVKQSPMQILEKYRLNFNVDEDQEHSQIQKYKENIIEFQVFLRKVIPVMEIQKKQLKKMIQVKDASDHSYKTIVDCLLKYEDNNVEFYSDSDQGKRTLTHPGLGDMKKKINSTFKRWKNPYKDAYYWLKGELLDLKGINEALLGREQVVKQQSACESKKRSDQAELDKLNQGKTSIKNIFKSKSSKLSEITKLEGEIELANKDIGDFKKLINFLTIYHGEKCIQQFKKEKSRHYLKTLNSICVKEISNSHLSATLWHAILEVEKN